MRMTMHRPVMKSPKHDEDDDYRRSRRYSGGTTPAPRPEPVMTPTPAPEAPAEQAPYLMVTVSLLDTGIPGVCEVYFQGKTKKAPLRIMKAAKVNVLLGPHSKGDLNCDGLLMLPFAEKIAGKDSYLVKVVDAETAQEVSAEMFSQDLRQVNGDPYKQLNYIFSGQSCPESVREATEDYLRRWPEWMQGGRVWLGGDVWRILLRRKDQPQVRSLDVKEFILVTEAGEIIGGIHLT